MERLSSPPPTPMPPASDEATDFDIRQAALDNATMVHRGTGNGAGNVVALAKRFEEYLRHGI